MVFPGLFKVSFWLVNSITHQCHSPLKQPRTKTALKQIHKNPMSHVHEKFKTFAGVIIQSCPERHTGTEHISRIVPHWNSAPFSFVLVLEVPYFQERNLVQARVLSWPTAWSVLLGGAVNISREEEVLSLWLPKVQEFKSVPRHVETLIVSKMKLFLSARARVRAPKEGARACSQYRMFPSTCGGMSRLSPLYEHPPHAHRRAERKLCPRSGAVRLITQSGAAGGAVSAVAAAQTGQMHQSWVYSRQYGHSGGHLPATVLQGVGCLLSAQ